VHNSHKYGIVMNAFLLMVAHVLKVIKRRKMLILQSREKNEKHCERENSRNTTRPGYFAVGGNRMIQVTLKLNIC